MAGVPGRCGDGAHAGEGGEGCLGPHPAQIRPRRGDHCGGERADPVLLQQGRYGAGLEEFGGAVAFVLELTVEDSDALGEIAFRPCGGSGVLPFELNEIAAQSAEKATAAIVEFVTGALADNPRRLSRPLTNELLGLRTARRGDYRVLFSLDTDGHILYVHRIEHRSELYTPR